MNVFNRSQDKMKSLVESGAIEQHSPKEVVEQTDIIFIMLSDSQAVRAILTQDNGVLEAIKLLVLPYDPNQSNLMFA